MLEKDLLDAIDKWFESKFITKLEVISIGERVSQLIQQMGERGGACEGDQVLIRDEIIAQLIVSQSHIEIINQDSRKVDFTNTAKQFRELQKYIASLVESN